MATWLQPATMSQSSSKSSYSSFIFYFVVAISLLEIHELFFGDAPIRKVLVDAYVPICPYERTKVIILLLSWEKERSPHSSFLNLFYIFSQQSFIGNHVALLNPIVNIQHISFGHQSTELFASTVSTIAPAALSSELRDPLLQQTKTTEPKKKARKSSPDALEVVVVGLSHHNARVDVREKLAIPEAEWNTVSQVLYLMLKHLFIIVSVINVSFPDVYF